MKVCYIDEVGMGSIAGPVLVCGVVLSPDATKIAGVNDSKKLTKQKRESLFDELSKLPHAFGTASPKSVETLNIFWARFLAMKRALDKLSKDHRIDKIIVDGKFEIPDVDIPQEAIIKADAKIWQVGAASILAKVKRDDIMAELAEIEKYSHYGWTTNAGYYTPEHRLGIVEYGPTPLHRKNFDYFKYSLYCHLKYQEFVKEGKPLEEYLAYENSEKQKYKQSYYTLWKQGTYDMWKEIPYGK